MTTKEERMKTSSWRLINNRNCRDDISISGGWPTSREGRGRRIGEFCSGRRVPEEGK